MEVFIEIGIILLLALGISIILKLLKQPLIVGYILAGILAGPYFFNFLKSEEEIELFSKLGIAILLFIVGLSLSPKVIRDVGKVSLVTGLGQIVFTSSIGFLIAYLFGYSLLPSLYIAIALTFSSTIIILKLLSDKGDVEKLYGKISIGFLLVQDLAATLILLFVSSLASNGSQPSLLYVFGRGVLFMIIFGFLAYKLLPKILDFFAKSQELLFLFSLTFGLALSGTFFLLGLSLEIGALFAGVLLSSSDYSYEISSKLRPLRDFFITLFFVLLGSQMVLDDFSTIFIPALIFSVFVLLGNPLIVFFLMNLLGYTKRVSFQAGLTVAQISEFSLILISLGFGVGHLSEGVLSLVTLVGMITIAGSTYLIMYSDSVYRFISPFLSWLEIRKKPNNFSNNEDTNYSVVMFGFNRIGRNMLDSLQSLTTDYLVVDYDPDVLKYLERNDIPHKYGDIEDVEFLNEIDIEKADMVISTVDDFDSNVILLDTVKHKNSDVIVVLSCDTLRGSIDLYKRGADYVIMSHYLGSQYASSLIKRNGLKSNMYKKSRKIHLENLKVYGSDR